MVSANDINSYTFDLGVDGPWKGASFGSNTIKNHYLGFKFMIRGEAPLRLGAHFRYHHQGRKCQPHADRIRL